MGYFDDYDTTYITGEYGKNKQWVLTKGIQRGIELGHNQTTIMNTLASEDFITFGKDYFRELHANVNDNLVSLAYIHKLPLDSDFNPDKLDRLTYNPGREYTYIYEIKLYDNDGNIVDRERKIVRTNQRFTRREAMNNTQGLLDSQSPPPYETVDYYNYIGVYRASET